MSDRRTPFPASVAYREALVAIGLVLLCLLTYANSLHNDFLVDDFNFLSRQYGQTFRTLGDFFTKSESQHYSPFYYLLNTTLFRLLPPDPFPFRVLNVMLFSLSCWLAYVLLLQLTAEKKLALLTAGLFCLHPINTVVVDQITFNFVLLYDIFMKLSLILLGRALPPNRLSRTYYGLSLLCGAFALLTFEGAVLLPLYVTAFIFLIERKDPARLIKFSLPYFTLSGLYIFLWLLIAGANAGIAGKAGLLSLTPLSYLAALAKLFGWYITRLVFPVDIVWMYALRPSTQNAALIGLTALALTGAAGVWCVRSAGKDWKASGLLWALTGCILVLPASLSHAYIGLVIEPYWLYFPSLGLFLLLGHFLTSTLKKMARPAGNIFLIILTISMFAVTQQYHFFFRTEESFCRHWLKVAPDNPIAQYRLGVIAAQEGRDQAALAHFYDVLNNGSYQSAKAHYNMGLIYWKHGDVDHARAHINAAIAAVPLYAAAYNTLGTIAVQGKDFTAAEAHFQKAAVLDPADPLPAENLGDLYLLTGQPGKAKHFWEGIDISAFPINTQTSLRAKLAAVTLKYGDLAGADAIMQDIFHRRPEAGTYIQVSRIFNAMELSLVSQELMAAGVSLFPKDKELRLYFGDFLAQGKQYGRAISIWEEGLSLDPTDRRFTERIKQTEELMSANP